MKKMQFKIYLFVGFLLSLTACKSEFETLRTGTDVNLMLKKSLEYYDKGDYVKAQSLMELVMPSIKGRPELEEISFKYGYTHYNLKSFVSASYYFKNFALTFANSKYREEAEYMSAYSEFLQSPSYKLDQENTAKAIEGFQYFVNNFPESKRVKDCNRLIDELRKKQEKKAFDEGELYFKLERYQASIQVFENLLKDYPETSDAERVRFLILKSEYLLAENSIYEKQLERYKLVVSKYNDFNDKFPRSRFKVDAEVYLKNSNKKIQELSNVGYQIKSTKS